MKAINIKKVIALTKVLPSEQLLQHIIAELIDKPFTEVINQDVLVVLASDIDVRLSLPNDKEIRQETEQEIKALEVSLFGQTKRADFLKSTCENFEQQIKELEALLKKYKNLLAQSQPGTGGRM